MYYFTEEEAAKISHELQVCRGRTMLYDSNQAPGTVLAIHSQKTDFEIAYLGEIQKGYLVIIVFNERSGLNVSAFCDLNGLSPVHATHKEITDGIRNQLVTKKFMEGVWSTSSGGNSLTVKIDKEKVSIDGRMNNINESAAFSSNGHWHNEYTFFFTGNPNYIISHADDVTLGISRLKTPGTIDKNYLWQTMLTRN